MYKLRELQRKDISAINVWRNREELVASLGAPFRFINQEVDERWFEDYMASRVNTVRCAIVTQECDEIIGLVSLTDINFINRSATLHIMIGNEAQGKGAGTFAVRAMCNHAFRNYGLHRIELDVLADNARARHVYEKCGFIQEGVRRNSVFKNGEFKDMVLYSRLSDENTVNMYGGGGSQKLFLLLPLHSSIQKEYAMRVCDTVFARSVLGREDYLSLFRKVDFLADFCVAYTDDVIGYVAMYANDLQSETAYITLIAVRRENQKVGVGSALIAWCESTAIGRGMRQLRLEVAKDNTNARSFYERHGFCYEAGQKEGSLYMRKSLEAIGEKECSDFSMRGEQQ